MSEPILECRISKGAWIWRGSLLRKRDAADQLAERIFETWNKLNEMWPNMPQNVERIVVPKKGKLQIVLAKPPRSYPWGNATIGIVNGFDVSVLPDPGASGVFSDIQRAAYLELYGQWHLRRALDVAHTGGHRITFVPVTDPEPPDAIDMETARRAAGSLFTVKDPDLWLEVTRPRERDREDEKTIPARRPDLHQTERDIAAARAFRPAVETDLSSAESRRFMERALARLSISARHSVRIIEVARSVAALDKDRMIGPAHLAEAIQYTPPEWRKRRNPSNGDEGGFWGKPVSVYTREQAVADGLLVDLSAIVPDVCRQHYHYPVACTAAVWAIIDKAARNRPYGNSVAGIVHDILWMSRVWRREISPNTVITRVIITGAGKRRLHDFKLVAAPGDKLEPVITVMLPEED